MEEKNFIKCLPLRHRIHNSDHTAGRPQRIRCLQDILRRSPPGEKRVTAALDMELLKKNAEPGLGQGWVGEEAASRVHSVWK